jgi:hypothetical protein
MMARVGLVVDSQTLWDQLNALADENDALNWIESVSEFDAADAPRKR